LAGRALRARYARAASRVQAGQDRGKDVPDTFLNLDVEFWSGDYRRYTVFLDPGRVKRGILPNDTFGRALVAGRRYTISVDAAWRDANGRPLASPFTQSFTAAPPDLTPIKLTDWRITPPAAGTRTPLLIAFPKALDHGILQRAIGVMRTGNESISGEVVVEPDAKGWSFRPSEPWRAGSYELVVLSILEDVCGNRIGRPFDIDTFACIQKSNGSISNITGLGGPVDFACQSLFASGVAQIGQVPAAVGGWAHAKRALEGPGEVGRIGEAPT